MVVSIVGGGGGGGGKMARMTAGLAESIAGLAKSADAVVVTGGTEDDGEAAEVGEAVGEVQFVTQVSAADSLSVNSHVLRSSTCIMQL